MRVPFGPNTLERVLFLFCSSWVWSPYPVPAGVPVVWSVMVVLSFGLETVKSMRALVKVKLRVAVWLLMYCLGLAVLVLVV